MSALMADFTKAVVATLVSLSPVDGVGALGFPVNVGDAKGALSSITSLSSLSVSRPDAAPLTRAVMAAVTKAVVAMLVSLSPAVGVGAFGVPVNVGEARGALPDATRFMPPMASQLAPPHFMIAVSPVPVKT